MASTRYADPRAFELYEENDGQEIVVTKLVPLPPGEALDAWLREVWLKPMVTEHRPGRGRGLVGHTREVPLGVVEEILSAGLPREGADDEEIPSILYKLRKFGPLPLKDHIGFVRFVPDTTTASTTGVATSTLVVWTIKTTPTDVGNVMCCGGSIVRLAMRSALAFFLSSFSSSVHKAIRHK